MKRKQGTVPLDIMNMMEAKKCIYLDFGLIEITGTCL